MSEPADRSSHESLWTITSASVPGAYHLEQDLQGDDAHAWAETEGDAIVFAVADGVGSARHAAKARAPSPADASPRAVSSARYP